MLAGLLCAAAGFVAGQIYVIAVHAFGWGKHHCAECHFDDSELEGT